MKITLYVATSSDGFIAEKDGGVAFLDKYHDIDDEGGHQEFLNSIDTLVMGKKSYRQAIGFGPWAWSNKKTYVFTDEPCEKIDQSITFVAGDIEGFVQELMKQGPNQQIWLFGGAHLVKQFSDKNLIDECIITVVPDVLEEGILLDISLDGFVLVESKSYPKKLIQKIYKNTRSELR